MNLSEVVILAGGLGTRLKEVVNKQPKAMAPINGRPFLEYQLDYLISKGISRAIISTGYLADQISDHFGNEYRSCSLFYSHEKEPLGTGGAIKKALELVKADYALVINGDTLFLGDIASQFTFHLEKKADVSLGLKLMFDFERYGTVLLDQGNRILKFEEKKPMKEGLVNMGFYIFNRDVFDKIRTEQKFSIEKDFFDRYVKDLNLYGFISDKYFLDIGIPQDLEKAQYDFREISFD